MLTITYELYKDSFSFLVFGNNKYKTQVYKFLDTVLKNELIKKKLIAVFAAINTNPRGYVHPQKFKHLEDDVWEIKIKRLRIACIWDEKPDNLVGIYAFDKKTNKWPKRNLKNMRNQKKKYFDIKSKILKGGSHHERLS